MLWCAGRRREREDETHGRTACDAAPLPLTPFMFIIQLMDAKVSISHIIHARVIATAQHHDTLTEYITSHHITSPHLTSPHLTSLSTAVTVTM